MRLSSFTDDPLDLIRESTNVRRELRQTTTGSAVGSFCIERHTDAAIAMSRFTSLSRSATGPVFPTPWGTGGRCWYSSLMWLATRSESVGDSLVVKTFAPARDSSKKCASPTLNA